MSNLREAAQQALAVLESPTHFSPATVDKVIGALRAALAKPDDKAQLGTIARMAHDFPHLQEFHTKYALGPMLPPSCLVCGKQTHPVARPVAIKHAELPGIVVCAQCRDATIAPQPPSEQPDKAQPVAYKHPAWLSMIAALRDLVNYVEAQTCQHDETYRGGAIWTVCRQCGQKWADDEGGFKPYEPPSALSVAHGVLAAIEKPVDPQPPIEQHTVPSDLGARYRVEFDGFVGTVIGSYTRLDGEAGVVMQQDGCKVVHVYRRKWLTTVEPPAEQFVPPEHEDYARWADAQMAEHGTELSDEQIGELIHILVGEADFPKDEEISYWLTVDNIRAITAADRAARGGAA